MSSMMHRSRLAAVLLLTVPACGTESGGGAGEEWLARVDTVGDTITVHTLAGSAWGDTARLEPEVTIGALDGPDEYIIGSPDALAVSPDGIIYVLDGQVPVLRAYGEDGVWLHDVGRRGSGPGEYDDPDGLAVLSDGRILVRDPPNSRITVYAPDGSWLEQWHLSGGFNTSRRFYVDRGDTSYVTALLERARDPWDWRFGLIRYAPNGEILDTVASPVWHYEPDQLTASGENSRSMRSVPFTPQTSWTFSPLGYMVGGLSTDYRIDLYHPDGSVLRLERDWTPVPVAPEESSERRRQITVSLQRQYGSWRWNGPSVPDTKPPFTEVFTSAEGDVWVLLSTEGVATMTEAEAREQEEETGRVPLRFVEPPAFDVFSPDGRYLGPVRVPASLRVEPDPIIRGDYVWAVTRDELDVARVTRFRIIRAVR